MKNVPPLPGRDQPNPEFPPPLPPLANDAKQDAPSTGETNRKPPVGILIFCAFVLLVFLLSAFSFLQSVLSSSGQQLVANIETVPTSPVASIPVTSASGTNFPSEAIPTKDNRAAKNEESDPGNESPPHAGSDSEPSDSASGAVVFDESQPTKITETKSDSGPVEEKSNENAGRESESKKTSDPTKETNSTAQEPETPSKTPVASSQPIRVLNTGLVKKTVDSEVNNETPKPTAKSGDSIPQGNNTEFTDRVEREGGKSGESQITLIWNNLNDLDLHLFCPSDEHIYFQHPKSRCGGALDIDMNAGFGETSKPVENIVWSSRPPASGRYEIWVKHFATQGGRNPTAFQILVKQGGRTRTFRGRLRHNEQRFITYLQVP